MPKDTAEHEAFEAWMTERDAGRRISPGVYESNGDGGYIIASVQAAWEGWKAGAAWAESR